MLTVPAFRAPGIARGVGGGHALNKDPYQRPDTGQTVRNQGRWMTRCFRCSSGLADWPSPAPVSGEPCYESQACTTVWRAILPSLSSSIAAQYTFAPSGYVHVWVKESASLLATAESTWCDIARPHRSS